ncbi:MAG: ISAs1 family transposase [Enterobacterales bacterium]|nr:ISAs1 family transposase [Enterobacterales bacterium]
MTNNFISHFSIINDPRIERHKKHQLIDILFLSVCAVLSGAEGWEDIEDFGVAKLDWMKKYLPFENGIPKHDTIARVLSRLEPASIQSCFIQWVQSIAQQTHMSVIAIDGKTARRSFTTKNRKNPLHMVSAWSCGHGLVLGQQRVDDKSNEITAIPKLLDLLDVKDSTVTLDAMGCQHSIADKIIEKGADYVIALKGNQGKLSEEVKAWFHIAHREKLKQSKFSQHEETDTGHGRIEVRRCLQLEIDNRWLSDSKDWSSIKSVICIESERHVDEIPDTQTMANILQQSGSISYKHCRNGLQNKPLGNVIFKQKVINIAIP